METQSLFDPRIPAHRNNPYPAYAELRANHPAYFNPVLQKWMVTRFTDVNKLLKDRRLSAQTATLRLPKNPMLRFLVRNIADTLPKTMIYNDPPIHTGLRQVAAKFFTKPKISELEGRIELLAKRTLDEVKNTSDFDLVSEFTFKFTASVIAELIGIPNEHLSFLGKHSARIATLVVSLSASPLQGIQASRSVGSLVKLFEKLVEEKRKTPGNDILSSLIHEAKVGGIALDDKEIINLAVLLVIAGHETTKNLMSTAIYTLLSRPEDYNRLRQNPEMMETAVEEFLRFDSSVQAVFRVALEDIDVAETVIPKGAPVLLMMGAANRDASTFDRPDDLILDRDPNPQISFGGGGHFCLGAFLARLEAKIGLNLLLSRFSKFEALEKDQDWQVTITHRGLLRLRLRGIP